ncbi:hypothetical protein Scep_026809 [Stephania cephalantha]|uniref:Uncharacterized protein n=1 Tax=Stephania cephalantha TaxID=152367 RepID=A0AAP0HTM7_9MAGN
MISLGALWRRVMIDHPSNKDMVDIVNSCILIWSWWQESSNCYFQASIFLLEVSTPTTMAPRMEKGGATGVPHHQSGGGGTTLMRNHSDEEHHCVS